MLRRLAFIAFFLLGLVPPALAQAPPPVPALPDTERRTAYTISSSLCTCAVNFALYGDGTDYQNWLEVWVNGVRKNYNDPTFGWTITSPSGVLSNLPRPITDAVLTFTNAQTGTIQIVSARRPRRTTQFNQNQGVASRDLNQALTDIVAQNRDTWDKLNDVTGRALISQPGVQLGNLPLPSACQGQLLGFDASGQNPVCVAGSGGGGVITSLSGVVISATYNFFAPFIGGDQSSVINTAMSVLSAAGGGVFYMPNGTPSPFSQALVVPANVQLYCAGTILSPSAPGTGYPVVKLTGNNSSVVGCYVNGGATVAGTRGSDGILFDSTTTFSYALYNTVYATGDNGIEINGQSDRVDSNYVHDNYTNGIYVIGTTGTRADWATITNNRVNTSSKGTTNWDGIDLDPCHDNATVKQNIVIGNDIIIAGAYSAPNLTCGVSYGDVISENYDYSSTENGLSLLGNLHDIDLNTNFVYLPSGHCIYDNTAAQPTFRIRIANNWCTTPTKHGIFLANFIAPSVTISNASPAVVTLTNNFTAGQTIVFQCSGGCTFPTGVTAGTLYYVIATGLTTGHFEISTSPGGSAVNTSGAQVGTIVAYSGTSLSAGATGGVTSADLIANHIENVGVTYDGIFLASAAINIIMESNVIVPTNGAYAIASYEAGGSSNVIDQSNTLYPGASGTTSIGQNQVLAQGINQTCTISTGGTLVFVRGALTSGTCNH